MKRPVSSAASVATTLLVLGRGLDVAPDGTILGLNASSRARVEAALAYVKANAAELLARRDSDVPGGVVFTGGWAGAAEGLPPPPPELREGHLMLELAQSLRIGDEPLSAYVEAVAEIDSDSTLENLLQVHEQGLLAGRRFTPDNPLGLVSDRDHLPRIAYFTRKVLGVPEASLRRIVAFGPDARSRGLSERTIYCLTRATFLGARTPRSLRRRERILVRAARLLSR